MAFLPMALAGGAALMEGASAIQNGLYQSAVAKNNAAIAEKNAASAGKAAQIEQMRSDREYAAQLGEQTAIQSASGLDLLGKTQVRTRMLTEQMRRAAATDIRRTGETNINQLHQDAANYKAEGRQAKLQGFLTGAGKLMEAGNAFSGGSSGGKSMIGSRKNKFGD